MKARARGAEPLIVTASCTGYRQATVTLGRFQTHSEGPGRSFEPRPGRESIPALTRRENEVLSLLSAGNSYRDIADALYISPETVHTHCKRIYRKLGITGRRELKAIALSHC
jgi:DNA-binding CsgD family transcriptional regulator